MIIRTAEDRKSEKIIKVSMTRWLRAIFLAASTTVARGSFLH